MPETLVGRQGLEPGNFGTFPAENGTKRRNSVPGFAEQATEGHATKTTGGQSLDDVLAVAIERASAAGRWDVVAQLARELEARRHEAAGNVVAIDPTRRRAR